MTSTRRRFPGQLHGGTPLRIHAVAELTGVPAATLRAWERRYGVPRPDRTASAYRLYGSEDVACIRRMQQLVASGVPASKAAATILGMRDAHDGSCRVADAVADTRDPLPTRGAITRLVDAATRFDGVALDRELAIVFDLEGPLGAFERVLAPALQIVGARWAAGELSLAHEHFAAERIGATLRTQLHALQTASSGPTVLLAAIEDEHHVVGLLGVALRFATWGFRSILLGACNPPSAIEVAVRAIDPKIVALSCTMGVERRRAATLARDYARAVGPTPWLIGGRGVSSLAPAFARVGARVFAGPLSELHRALRGLGGAESDASASSPARAAASSRARAHAAPSSPRLGP